VKDCGFGHLFNFSKFLFRYFKVIF
jgi:hypothetical protein